MMTPMSESSSARSASHPAIPERGASAPPSRGYIANAMSGTHAALDADPGLSGVLGAVRRTAAPIEDPDFEYIEAWRRGSNAALDALFQRVQPRIHGICLRMLSRPDVAADVAQDAFLRIYEGLPGFDGRARFSTWSIRVTLNCIYTHLRREKLRRHARLPEPDTGHEPGSREPGPEDRIERSDLRRNVVVALGALDLQARAILVLRDLQGLDYADIAEVLGTPIGTVKSRLFRARAALREALEALGHGRG
jgi:RNA polymerase sigma-70 factor (ECF subfamily)